MVCFFFFGYHCCAQKAKTIEATQQDWSGGIAGRRGSNYDFTVQIPGTKATMIPDTIWIGADAIALDKKEKGGYNNYSIRKTKNTTTIDISARVSKDDYADSYPVHVKEDPRGKRPVPPRYKGVALVSYKLNGKRRYYTIEKILQRPDPINYP